MTRSEDGGERIETSHLLVAAGRTPNSDLDLNRCGVETDAKGFVKVNEFLETTVPGIWAVGDINGQQPFTRVCQEEGKVAFANAFEGARIKMERRYLGHAIFTEPQVGSVGLTSKQAREAGFDVATGLATFDNVAKAKLIGETAGFIKYVFDRKSHHLLGCHVIGPAAAELIYAAILVMRHRGTIDEIAKAVGIFPTLQEGLEGTARALLRKVAPEEVAGPLVAGSVHHEGPCFPTKTGSPSRTGIQTIEEEPTMPGTKDFSCPECAAEFETQEELDGHNKTIHNKQTGGQQQTKQPPEKRTA